MRTHHSLVLIALLLFIPYVSALGQTADSSPSKGDTLLIGGEVDHPIKLTLADLKKLPRQLVKIEDHDGAEAAYEGVAVLELLRQAGASLGKNLRGKALANYLLVEAKDGFRVVYAVPEIDSEFSSHLVLLADTKDNKPLSEKDGPLQIINTGEQRHARWVRGVSSMMIRKPD